MWRNFTLTIIIQHVSSIISRTPTRIQYPADDTGYVFPVSSFIERLAPNGLGARERKIFREPRLKNAGGTGFGAMKTGVTHPTAGTRKVVTPFSFCQRGDRGGDVTGATAVATSPGRARWRSTRFCSAPHNAMVSNDNIDVLRPPRCMVVCQPSRLWTMLPSTRPVSMYDVTIHNGRRTPMDDPGRRTRYHLGGRRWQRHRGERGGGLLPTIRAGDHRRRVRRRDGAGRVGREVGDFLGFDLGYVSLCY